MNNIRISIIALLALMLVISCSKKPDPVLQEAFGVHEKVVAASGEVESMLTEADQMIAKLKAAYGNLTEESDSTMEMKIGAAVTQLQFFRPNYQKWEDALVEVPGIEHDHDHSHGGHHEHKPIPDHIKNMAPTEILALQKEFLVQIEGMKGALQTAMKAAGSML